MEESLLKQCSLPTGTLLPRQTAPPFLARAPAWCLVHRLGVIRGVTTTNVSTEHQMPGIAKTAMGAIPIAQIAGVSERQGLRLTALRDHQTTLGKWRDE